MVAGRNSVRPYLIRLAIVFSISVLVVVAFNEVSFFFQKDDNDRAPETITLIIPEGTAEQVSAGVDVAAIPEELEFVLGDVLEVQNQDTVSHQLGPVWVPAGSTASLVMEQADRFAYSCSFQTSRYLGLDVREPTTIGTRILGIALAAPTMTVLVFLYSLLVFPVDKKDKSDQESSAGRDQVLEVGE